jgi:hypothetical protein
MENVAIFALAMVIISTLAIIGGVVYYFFFANKAPPPGPPTPWNPFVGPSKPKSTNVLQFIGDGCASADIKTKLGTTFDINFKIKMSAPYRCALLTMGDPGPASSGCTLAKPCNPILAIYMDYQFVSFIYSSKNGSAFALTLIDVFSFSDQNWHSMTVSRRENNQFTLACDDRSITVGSSGTPDEMPPSVMTLACNKFGDAPIFKGCISDVMVNGALINVFRREGTVLDNCG